MTCDLSQRRLVRAAYKYDLFGCVPLVIVLVVVVEMAIIGRLVSRFNAVYAEKPVLTMMVTNAMLGGIADTVAQSITEIRQRAARKPGGIKPTDKLATEIHELDRKNPMTDYDLVPVSRLLPPPFDFERLARFMLYGFAMAPLQFKWFKVLEKTFPITKGAAFGPAMKRVVADQLVFAPFGLTVFFTTMTLAEGGGIQGVQAKLRDMFVPTLKANYLIWPAVQVINFRLMPVQFQLPFVSTVGIAWTAYLSLTNAALEVKQKEDPVNSSLRLA